MLQKNIMVENLNINFYRSDNFSKSNALVFLHGWGTESLAFKNILAKCENFAALDLPGFGRSDFPKEAWSVSDYADFLEKFLEKLEIKNPILAGHSFGGRIIAKYCSSRKDVKKIILIAGAGIKKKKTKFFFYKIGAKVFRLIFSLPRLRGLRDKLRRNFYKSINSEDYINSGRLKETYQKVIAEDLSGDMKKISAETVLIWGENDAETLLEDGKKISNLIKNSKLFVIKNAGHYVFLDQPEKFNAIFLKETHAD